MNEIALSILAGSIIISITIMLSAHDYHSELAEIKKAISELRCKEGGKNDD